MARNPNASIVCCFRLEDICVAFRGAFYGLSYKNWGYFCCAHVSEVVFVQMTVATIVVLASNMEPIATV